MGCLRVNVRFGKFARVAWGGGAGAKQSSKSLARNLGTRFVVASFVRLCYNPPAPVRARFRRAFIDMNQYQYRKLTELVIFLAENAELIEKAIYLLFVMLN